MTLPSAAVGFGIIALAVVALILTNVTTGLVAIAGSVMPNAIASIFVQTMRAHKRLDIVTRAPTKSYEA